MHAVHGQEQLTRFDARLAFKEKVCFDLVDLYNYVNETLTNVAREAALALALPTNLVRQEDAVGIRARQRGKDVAKLVPASRCLRRSPREVIEHIRQTRAGARLPKGYTLRRLIEEGRRF